MNDGSRVVLITGAARRIGAAVARDLASVGWSVAVHHHRSLAAAQALVGTIAANGGCAQAFATNLQSEAETSQLVGRVADALGPVHCLINNASVFERDDALSVTRESWERHLQINLRAPFLLTQAFARQVPESGGCVINVLDQRVWNLTPHFTSYTVSKAALWTLTQTLAMALAPKVRVNAIGPGPTLPSVRQSEEQFVRQWSAVPLARPTSPLEIAGVVRFLLDAPGVTGQMIAVDGGQHLGWTVAKRHEAVDE